MLAMCCMSAHDSFESSGRMHAAEEQELKMSAEETESIFSYLSRDARDDLVHLAKYAEKLPGIASSATELEPGIGFSGIGRIVGERTGTTVPEVNRILWTIWNLYQLKNRTRLDTSGLLGEISGVLENRSPDKWKNENLETWNKATAAVSEFVDQLTDTHPLIVARKAERLGYAHQNVFAEARIVTDVRPVFDAGADKILESFVTQSLLIDYLDGGESRQIEFALDAADVSQLRRLCERAERKALVLKAELDKLPWPSAVLGQEGSWNEQRIEEDGT